MAMPHDEGPSRDVSTPSGPPGSAANPMSSGEPSSNVERGRASNPSGEYLEMPPLAPVRSYSPSRPPTSAEIDAVIAAAMANAPPAPPPPELTPEPPMRSVTPLMTNLLPSAVGQDGRVNLFVGNLPYRVRWQDLKDLFRKAGTVLRADVSLGPDNRSRGYGTVLMGSREDAARAIDRFNGYTWQTRTLEVRPDRLPPEYEPQPHIPHHMQHRPPPMYPYQPMPGPNGMPGMPYAPVPMAIPGGMPSWMSGPMQNQRGPPGPGLGSGPGPGPGPGLAGSASQGVPYGGDVNGPGMNTSPVPPALGQQQSPPMSYGNLPLPGPLPGREPPGGFPIAASPLAGALTGTPPLQGVLNERRPSLAPFSTTNQDALSTATANGMNSRPIPVPTGTAPQAGPATAALSKSPSDGLSTSNRAPPPGSLGALPPNMFTGKAVGSPTESAASNVPAGNGRSVGVSLEGEKKAGVAVVPGEPVPHFPVQMEGLAHQGMGLGPPSNLHDRVVFVSNMPLTMQWQDLKDLLRPAGLIMRADVAQDENRRPRGYGTALFATETDAARAVHIFNGREIAGRQIRVYLERDAHHMTHPSSQPPFHLPSPPRQGLHIDAAEHSGYGSPDDSNPTSPIGSRIPWGINTSMAQTPQRPASDSPNGYAGGPTPGPIFRTGIAAAGNHPHPGPINLPPFGLDSPNPLSPHGRALPPMTPSMPGFVFNAFPETPHPHHFLSPGAVGPFSPGIPVTSPTGFAYNPFLNPAPGAPVERFHAPSGSAALGTPTTTSFPGNPVTGWGSASAPGAPPNGTPGPFMNGANSGNQDYFPLTLSRGSAAQAQETPVRGRYTAGGVALNARDRLAVTGSAAGAEGGKRGMNGGPSGSQPSVGGDGEVTRGLVGMAGRLSLGSEGQGDDGGNTPNGGSPTKEAERRRAAIGGGTSNGTTTSMRGSTSLSKGLGIGMGLGGGGGGRAPGGEVGLGPEEDVRLRQSLDEARPSFSFGSGGTGVGLGLRSSVSSGAVEGGERRASFDDAGR